MTRSTGFKRATKAPTEHPLATPISTITLSEEQPQTTPLNAALIETSYPLCPLLSTPERILHDTQDNTPPVNDTQDTEAKEKEKEKPLDWTEEMKEQLVDTLFEVFQAGGGSDNSFKNAVFELAATNVRKAYKGSATVTLGKVKNKWGDFKKKWNYWKLLSEQSSFGWDEEKELFQAYDYV
jgi:hypothetical protein